MARKVTDSAERRTAAERYEALLLKSAAEALQIARGKRLPARQRERTARDTVVAPPPVYSAGQIRRVREGLRVSQPVFAGVLNVSPSTVRSWEQGIRSPEGSSLRLLQIAEKEPTTIMRHAGERAFRSVSLASN